MAADSVTLEMLKGLLAANKSNAASVQGETAKTLGRKSKPGFTLSKKEIKSMPEKYRKIFACEDRIIPYRFHKGVYEAHYRRDGFKVFACAKDVYKRQIVFSISQYLYNASRTQAEHYISRELQQHLNDVLHRHD